MSVGSRVRGEARSWFRALAVACALVVAGPAPAGSALAPEADPVAVVNEWLDALTRVDYASAGALMCEAERAGYIERNDPRPGLRQAPNGVDGDALFAAVTMTATDRVITLLGSDAATASVAVRATVKLRVEEAAARLFLRQLFDATGRSAADELLDRMVPQLAYTMGGPATSSVGQRLDATMILVREAGEWRICGDDRGYVSGDKTGPGRPVDARAFATVVVLDDGRTLLAGGLGEEGVVLASAEVFDPDTSMFAATGTMTVAGAQRPGLLLDDGSVLVAGGYGADQRALAAAEGYDPDSGTFTSMGPMSAGRLGHGMSHLPDGDVLVSGGGSAEDTTDVYAGRRLASSTERFELASGAFGPAPSMSQARFGHAQVALHDGRTLVAGGTDGFQALATAEVYDGSTRRFEPTGSLAEPRADFAAVVLLDGRVLMLGGVRASPPATQDDYLDSAEVYDPVTDTFARVGSMTTPRRWCSATLLPDGRVLVVGGRDAIGSLITAEVFDPRSESFTPTGDLTVPGFGLGAVTLPDGRVLVTGGANEFGVLRRAEVWDPATGAFGPVERQ